MIKIASAPEMRELIAYDCLTLATSGPGYDRYTGPWEGYIEWFAEEGPAFYKGQDPTQVRQWIEQELQSLQHYD
jgi:hypothetical protein